MPACTTWHPGPVRPRRRLTGPARPAGHAHRRGRGRAHRGPAWAASPQPAARPGACTATDKPGTAERQATGIGEPVGVRPLCGTEGIPASLMQALTKSSSGPGIYLPDIFLGWPFRQFHCAFSPRRAELLGHTRLITARRADGSPSRRRSP